MDVSFLARVPQLTQCYLHSPRSSLMVTKRARCGPGPSWRGWAPQSFSTPINASTLVTVDVSLVPQSAYIVCCSTVIGGRHIPPHPGCAFTCSPSGGDVCAADARLIRARVYCLPAEPGRQAQHFFPERDRNRAHRTCICNAARRCGAMGTGTQESVLHDGTVGIV